MVKTFKIGEYAVGGIIKASVKPYKGRIHCLIKFQDYDTRETILTMQNQMGLTHSMEQIDSFLEAHTSYYYAEQVSQWIESSYLKQKP
jgi:phosphopantetheine adenylyltransferase